MSSYLAETNTKILVDLASPELAGQVAAQLSDTLSVGESPVRFAVTESHGGRWSCEVGLLSGESTDRVDLPQEEEGSRGRWVI